MPQSINIRVQLEDQWLRDVMTTMVESGAAYCIGYWDDGDPTFFQKLHVSRNEDAEVTMIGIDIDPTQCPVDWANWFTLDYKSVSKAIESLLEKWSLRDDLMEHLMRGVAQGDAGEIDAELADCIAQEVCFRSQVFG
jgi:hypothetical protein